ncbi:MAG: hypothetical protein AAGD00_07215 [Planctomycetota bacterium]
MGATSALGGIMLPSGGALLSEIQDPNGPYDGTFVVGDKEITVKAFAALGIDAVDVTVVPVNFGDQAIGFDLLGQFIDVPGDGSPTGFGFQYNIRVLDPDRSIVGVELGFNGSTSVAGSFAKVTETIVDPNSSDFLDNLEVQALGNMNSGDDVFQDFFTADAPGFRELNITKDFTLFAVDGGTATTSFIRQTFEQIPAPGAFAAFGVAGLAAARRRR